MFGKKTVALVGAGLVAVATMIESTFAAVYTLSGSDVSSIGTASADTATSLFGTLAQLLPVFIPLIVIGFVLSLVMSQIHKRG